ncbi:hypothetical protein P7B02_13750 [Caulobacter segnis]|uniref:hypothetical protein n=1 Tax=Caulobacter segnis TaxID=88688 RepID=UPI00241058ED|nr:hypothetical protein [Caulobacter segnis]MDG2522609.1 hypothetical protein [Caulobacter segnis]
MSNKAVLVITAMIGAMASAHAADKPAKPEPASEARAFAHDDGVVDLLIIGPAAKVLYERLPGKGRVQACGGAGLHKGDGRITCRKDDDGHACHIWLDARKQTLADAEIDDC